MLPQVIAGSGNAKQIMAVWEKDLKRFIAVHRVELVDALQLVLQPLAV